VTYDEDLAYRIRELLAAEHGIQEKKMFGGLAFLVGGNMAISASGQGGVLVRPLGGHHQGGGGRYGWSPDDRVVAGFVDGREHQAQAGEVGAVGRRLRRVATGEEEVVVGTPERGTQTTISTRFT